MPAANPRGVNGPRPGPTHGRLRNTAVNIASKGTYPAMVANRPPVPIPRPAPVPMPGLAMGTSAPTPSATQPLQAQNLMGIQGANLAALQARLSLQSTQALAQLMSQLAVLQQASQARQGGFGGGGGGLFGRLLRKGAIEASGREHITGRRLFTWDIRGGPDPQMTRGALRGLVRASDILKPGRGYTAIPGGGYRSAAQQAALYRQKPGLAAPPGRSLHERGLAIDVLMNFLARNPRARAALLRVGFRQFSPQGEPWHFSWRRVG